MLSNATAVIAGIVANLPQGGDPFAAIASQPWIVQKATVTGHLNVQLYVLSAVFALYVIPAPICLRRVADCI